MTKFAVKWMDLECIKLGEVIQSKKIPHVLPHIWDLASVCVCVYTRTYTGYKRSAAFSFLVVGKYIKYISNRESIKIQCEAPQLLLWKVWSL